MGKPYTAFGTAKERYSIARNTLSKKDIKELRQAAGVPSGDKRTVLLLTGLTALVLLAIAGFSFLVTAGTDKGFTPNEQGLLPVGSQAPDFTAETVDGSSVSLGDTGDKKATMLVFFASWCPHCNKVAPLISQLENEYENLRVIMVGIDGQDDPETVREFVDRYGIEGPAAYESSLGSTYQASGYPTIYFIDENGEIVAAHSGEAPKSVLEGWAEEALGNSA